MLVYKATFLNGKSYIGITTLTLSKRRKDHFTAAKKGDNCYFHKAILKYGRQAVYWEVLQEGFSDISELKEAETFNIIKYDTYVPFGYNMTMGGDGINGYRASEADRKRMSIKRMGFVHSAETKLKISEAHIGKKATEDTRKKCGAWQLGRKLPDTTVAKLKISSKNRRPKQHCCVICGSYFLSVVFTAKYCSDSCYKKVKNEHQKIKYHNTVKVPAIKKIRVCLTCGVTFLSTQPNAGYCSDNCYKKEKSRQAKLLYKKRKLLCEV